MCKGSIVIMSSFNIQLQYRSKHIRTKLLFIYFLFFYKANPTTTRLKEKILNSGRAEDKTSGELLSVLQTEFLFFMLTI